MAETLSAIATRLRAEYPQPQYDVVDGERVKKTSAEYTAWIADQAIAIRNQQLTEEERTTAEAAVAAVLTKLEADQDLTPAEMRIALRRLLNVRRTG